MMGLSTHLIVPHFGFTQNFQDKFLGMSILTGIPL
jgi:hypothetical protein